MGLLRNSRYDTFEKSVFDPLRGVPENNFPWVLLSEPLTLSPDNIWQVQVHCLSLEPSSLNPHLVKAQLRAEASQECDALLLRQCGLDGARLRHFEPDAFVIRETITWAIDAVLADLQPKARAYLGVLGPLLKKKFTQAHKHELIKERVARMPFSRFSDGAASPS